VPYRAGCPRGGVSGRTASRAATGASRPSSGRRRARSSRG
jgi:hypothetical protein